MKDKKGHGSGGKRKVIAPEGYFVFSKAQLKKEDLLHWENWFKEKKIKTCIIKHEGKHYLCRQGKESKQ